jgi:hypothetical protein
METVMRRSLARLVPAAALVLVTGALVVVTGAAPAAAGPGCGTAHVGSDFNGDGIADAAIADGDFYVRVLYGTRAGLTVAASGSAPSNQEFGAPGTLYNVARPSLVAADFNGDGCADLAVGEPADAQGSLPFVGRVHVYYGSPTGLQTPASIVTETQVPGVTAANGSAFGWAVAAGDFNHDGLADLAVGAFGRNASRGQVFIFPGNRLFAVGAAGGRVFAEGDGTVTGVAEPDDRFGSALATGDFDGDGRSDLAVGDPGEDDSTGAVMVVRGSGDANLLTATGARTWMQSTDGIEGGAQPGDKFGTTLVTGSFRAAGETDLAIGVPNEGVDGLVNAGAVNVIYSAGSAGLTAAGNQVFTNPTGDQSLLGRWLAAGDFDGNGRDELAVGIPGATIGGASAGAVQILPSSSTGLTTIGSTLWSQASSGVPGSPEADDGFGDGLLALRVTSATRADLLIASTGETFAGNSALRGMVELLPGSPSGPTATGVQEFDGGTAGLVHSAPSGSGFGIALG